MYFGEHKIGSHRKDQLRPPCLSWKIQIWCYSNWRTPVNHHRLWLKTKVKLPKLVRQATL